MTHPDSALKHTWQAFTNPPDSARPRAWWHWMDGNIDPAGVELDLRWLHRVGVRGVQMFDGGMGVPLVVREAVRPGSKTWDAAIRAAFDTAVELSLEVAVATSAGWSAAGGPWVTSADSMKKIVWASAVVDGGREVDAALPALPDTPGHYQDAPRWGATAEERWSTTWRVLAIPTDETHEALVPDRTTASGAVPYAGALNDGSFASGIDLPRDPDARSSAWIKHTFDEPVTVRSVVVGLPGPRGFGAAPPAEAWLEVSDDGTTYREVVQLPASTVPARTAAFAPVTARHFRLVLSADSAADALPPLDDGVRMPPVLRRSDRFTVTAFALHTGGRIHHAETKAGFGVEGDYYAVDTPPASEHGVLDPLSVIDLTDAVRDGRLSWQAPPGRWRILHLGASSTGQTNGPAPADSTGLEVDKLDGERVRAYLDRYLERFGPSPSAIGALLSDSIEAGPQNWTDRIIEHFERLRGYDPTPWLPALTGLVVRSSEMSDRFLYDYRRTLGDLLNDEYYGTLADAAHERGWTYYAEALEDGRPQLGDDLAMRARADVPMGAMWSFDPSRGPRPTYVADLKGAASVAHVHGHSQVGAEAFTSFERPWSSTPASLKHIADLQLALGVTRFCIHTSPHQPESAPAPGIALAPFLGQAFTRHETWADMAAPWIDYLARCCAVLALGEAAVDVAVFVGEEAPVTGLFYEDLDTAVPDGFDFDYVGIEGLRMLRVERGEIAAVAARFRLLFLSGSSDRMTVAALRILARLQEDGATIVGMPPTCSPSLTDDDGEFETLRASVWRPGGATAAHDLASALAELGLAPEWRITGAPVRRISRIIDGRLVTFVANPQPEPITVTISSDATALEVWDPVRVRRHRLERGDAAFALKLAPFASAFVVETDHPAVAECSASRRRLVSTTSWTLTIPGEAPRDLGETPHLWTDLSPSARAFSGTAVYEAMLDGGDNDAHKTWLNLGTVEGVARVFVNGDDCGVAWTAPYTIDVSDSWRSGPNRVCVHVANPWRNRLIAEAGTPTGEIFAPMTQVFEPTAEPLPAGLAGPVDIIVES